MAKETDSNPEPKVCREAPRPGGRAGRARAGGGERAPERRPPRDVAFAVLRAAAGRPRRSSSPQGHC